MDATTARALLEDLLQVEVAPALIVPEVDRLFARVALATDASGREPGEAGYVATHTARAVEAQVGRGWLMKAAKVAAQYEVGVGGGKTFKRDQQYRMCAEMAARYGAGGAGGGIGSLLLTTATATATGG